MTASPTEGRDRHGGEVERAFTAQAAAFEDPRLNQVFAQDIGWMFAGLQLDPAQIVLEVAAGTGQVARALAPHVRTVLALDVTRAMLDQGRRAADAERIANVIFMECDAARLPFADASFDAVACRYALHHFQRPSLQLAEMARCLRPGGQLVVADLVAADSAAIAARQDRLERIRDPSHTSLLSTAELRAAVERAGATVVDGAAKQTRRPLDMWLEHTTTADADAAQIVAALHAELDGGDVTGFQPVREVAGELTFVQSFASVVGRKAAARPAG